MEPKPFYDRNKVDVKSVGNDGETNRNSEHDVILWMLFLSVFVIPHVRKMMKHAGLEVHRTYLQTRILIRDSYYVVEPIYSYAAHGRSWL